MHKQKTTEFLEETNYVFFRDDNNNEVISECCYI